MQNQKLKEYIPKAHKYAKIKQRIFKLRSHKIGTSQNKKNNKNNFKYFINSKNWLTNHSKYKILEGFTWGFLCKISIKYVQNKIK